MQHTKTLQFELSAPLSGIADKKTKEKLHFKILCKFDVYLQCKMPFFISIKTYFYFLLNLNILSFFYRIKIYVYFILKNYHHIFS